MVNAAITLFGSGRAAMVEDVQDQAVVLPGERAKTIAAMEILLRILRKAVDCYPDDDLETILIVLTVAAASTGQHLRDLAVLDLVADEPLPDHLHRPISGRAIAEASGLPRETVRRRLESLVASGRLIREPSGFRTRSGALTRGRTLEFARTLVHEMNGAAARIARFDVS